MTEQSEPDPVFTPEELVRAAHYFVASIVQPMKHVIARLVADFKVIETALDAAYENAGKPRGPSGKWEWLLDIAAKERAAAFDHARACGRVTDRCCDPDPCQDCPR